MSATKLLAAALQSTPEDHALQRLVYETADAPRSGSRSTQRALLQLAVSDDLAPDLAERFARRDQSNRRTYFGHAKVTAQYLALLSAETDPLVRSAALRRPLPSDVISRLLEDLDEPAARELLVTAGKIHVPEVVAAATRLVHGRDPETGTYKPLKVRDNRLADDEVAALVVGDETLAPEVGLVASTAPRWTEEERFAILAAALSCAKDNNHRSAYDFPVDRATSQLIEVDELTQSLVEQCFVQFTGQEPTPENSSYRLRMSMLKTGVDRSAVEMLTKSDLLSLIRHLPREELARDGVVATLLCLNDKVDEDTLTELAAAGVDTSEEALFEPLTPPEGPSLAAKSHASRWLEARPLLLAGWLVSAGLDEVRGALDWMADQPNYRAVEEALRLALPRAVQAPCLNFASLHEVLARISPTVAVVQNLPTQTLVKLLGRVNPPLRQQLSAAVRELLDPLLSAPDPADSATMFAELVHLDKEQATSAAFGDLILAAVATS